MQSGIPGGIRVEILWIIPIGFSGEITIQTLGEILGKIQGVISEGMFERILKEIFRHPGIALEKSMERSRQENP